MKLKMVLVSPNKWCLNHNFTKNKIYEIDNEIELSKFESLNVYPAMVAKNDLGINIIIPIQCFDILKNVRKQKLNKLNENR